MVVVGGSMKSLLRNRYSKGRELAKSLTPSFSTSNFDLPSLPSAHHVPLHLPSPSPPISRFPLPLPLPLLVPFLLLLPPRSLNDPLLPPSSTPQHSFLLQHSPHPRHDPPSLPSPASKRLPTSQTNHPSSSSRRMSSEEGSVR